MCLVIDSAQCENCHLQLERWNVSYLSLFERTPEQSLIEIAPLLVPVNELATHTRNKLFRWCEQLAYSAPCLSWFDTVRSSICEADRFRHFHVVGLSEGQSMLLRWYDTRILPVLFACLTSTQASLFASELENWEFVDRSGQICSLALQRPIQTRVGAQSLGAPALILDDVQYGLLVDSADLDVLLGHLRQIIPDELAKVPARQLALFVSLQQQAAKQAGLNDIGRQTQYLLLALYTSGKGVDQAAFKAFIKSPPAQLDEFSKKLQALPDGVWYAGPPLWESMSQSE